MNQTQADTFMIACTTLSGRIYPIPRSRLQFRPSAYGIVVHAQHLLLLRTRSTGKYDLPGGGVEIGERLANGLQREILEESGIKVEVGRQCHFAEEFFYYEPTAEAFHSYRFYYLCHPLTLTLVADAEVDDEEVIEPRWVPVHGLQAHDFQSYGEMILTQVGILTGTQADG